MSMIIIPVQIFTIMVASWVAAGLINYLADVLPVSRKLVRPSCKNCSLSLNLIYYIAWPIKCSNCGKKVDFRHWIVRVGFMLLVLFIWLYSSSIALHFIPAFFVLMYFMLVSVIDYEHRIIMHPTSVLGAVLGVLVGFNLHGFTSTVTGGIVGFFGMLILYLFGSVFVSWLARRRQKEMGEEALGFGDVILGGVLGLFIGMPGTIISLMLAIFSAGAVSIIYLLVALLKRENSSNLTIPYGPFLIFGAFTILFLKNNLLLVMGW